MKLLNGQIKVPVAKSSFGDYLNFNGLIPPDCDCVMVLINTGGGLNAGLPQPVGFLKLSHQIYVKDIEALIERFDRQRDNVQNAADIRWITVCPVRSKDHLDIWEAEG